MSAAVVCLATVGFAQDQKFADLDGFKLVSSEVARNY
jgi:hypothetical protein